MRPQHAREASQRAQTEREGCRGEGGKHVATRSVLAGKARAEWNGTNDRRPSTVDNVIKFSAYLFATNKIKTIVKMREKERKREGEKEGSSMWHSLPETKTGTDRGCWVRALPTNI